MKDQFKRILDLVRKTGDTMVVTDTNGKDVYVVMDLEHYESMIEEITSDDDCLDCDHPHETEKPHASTTETQLTTPEEWQIPEEFVIDEPEGGLADEEPPTVDEGPLQTPSSGGMDVWNAMQSANEPGPTWDIQQMNPEEIADLEKQYRAFAEKTTVVSQTQAQEEVKEPPKKAQIDDFSEEQFYLEPIE